MNSLGSWIDKAELDRLVAAVGTRPDSEPSSDSPPAQAPHRPKFPWNRPADAAAPQPQNTDEAASTPPAPERFPVAEEVEKFRNKVAAIKDKARALGVLSPGSPEPTKNYSEPPRTARIKVAPGSTVTSPAARTYPKFRPPQGPLRLRLECFGEWASTVARAQAVIVADSQGDLVFERGANPAWVSSVSMVASAGEQAGRHLAISGNTVIHLDLPADRKLAVLPCQTKFGHLSVGLVVPSPLQPEIARSIAEAITTVIARQ